MLSGHALDPDSDLCVPDACHCCMAVEEVSWADLLAAAHVRAAENPRGCDPAICSHHEEAPARQRGIVWHMDLSSEPHADRFCC